MLVVEATWKPYWLSISRSSGFS